MINYDSKLIQEAINYFSSLYSRDISPEEAESFLKSLVYLFDSFSLRADSPAGEGAERKGNLY